MNSLPGSLLTKLTSTVGGILILGTVVLGTGCSKSAPAEGSFANDLKSGPPAPVARGGIADDGIKPGPLKPVAKGGIADDGVKPIPIKPILNGGIIDDGIKPMPGKPVTPPTPR